MALAAIASTWPMFWMLMVFMAFSLGVG